MFPKFLKVTSNHGQAIQVRFNETHVYNEVFLPSHMQNMLNMFADALGFSYEFVLQSEKEIGFRLPNGNWTGILGKLQRREIDMVVGNLIFDEGLHEDFRPIYPHTFYETTFVTKKPEPVSVMAYFLHAFSIPVWLAIIACIFLMPSLFRNLLKKEHNFLSLFTSTLGSLVGQGLGIRLKRSRNYFLLATWIVSSALLYHFYAAVLLSFLTFPSLHGIRTVDDLAKGIKDGTYDCSTYPDNYPIPRYLKQFENPTVKIIVNNFNNSRYNNFAEYIETYVGDKKPAFVVVRQDTNDYKDLYFISEENFFTVTSSFAVHKEFCCSSKLDNVVHRAWSAGILRKVYDDFLRFSFSRNREKYGKMWNNPSEGKLTLTQLKGLFIFLIASHSLAFVVFLIEVCTYKFKMLERFKDKNLKKKISFTLTAVKSEVAFLAKGRINGDQRPRKTNRKKWKSKHSLSISTPISKFPDS